jgi:hypothetical protein
MEKIDKPTLESIPEAYAVERVAFAGSSVLAGHSLLVSTSLDLHPSDTSDVMRKAAGLLQMTSDNASLGKYLPSLIHT